MDRVWTQFANDSFRLLDCPVCAKTIDPFFEFELTTLLLFFILRDRRVAAHLLYNRGASGSVNHLVESFRRVLRTILVLGMLADAYVAGACVSATASIPITACAFANWGWLAGRRWAGVQHENPDAALAYVSRDAGRAFLCSVCYSAFSVAAFGLMLWWLLRWVTGQAVPPRVLGVATILVKALPPLIVACITACGTPHQLYPLVLLVLTLLIGQTVVGAVARLPALPATGVLGVAWTAATAFMAVLGSRSVVEAAMAKVLYDAPQ